MATLHGELTVFYPYISMFIQLFKCTLQIIFITPHLRQISSAVIGWNDVTWHDKSQCGTIAPLSRGSMLIKNTSGASMLLTLSSNFCILIFISLFSNSSRLIRGFPEVFALNRKTSAHSGNTRTRMVFLTERFEIHHCALVFALSVDIDFKLEQKLSFASYNLF